MSSTENYRHFAAREALGLPVPKRSDWSHLTMAWANIGQRHPHYGMTTAEHEAAKRNSNDPSR